MVGEPSVQAMDVDGAAPFDLEGYISCYSGYTKIDRLRFIAERAHGQPLELEALRLAANELKVRSENVKQYQTIMDMIGERLGPDYVLDPAWIDKVQTHSNNLREKLEDDLNAARTNSIRESIRRGQMDLGDFYYSRGDFLEASKWYMRCRDFCNTQKQVSVLSFHISVIKTYIHAHNWTMVSTYVHKAETSPEASDDKCYAAKLQVACGLANLENRRYSQAANHFTSVHPELGNSFDDVIAAHDIAVYGALSALAAYDRKDVRAKCLQRPSFSFFMESMPQVRELLEAFCSSNYADAFRVLSDLQPTLQYDIYIASHLDSLIQRIRCRALKQYTVPFDALLIPSMAESFGVDTNSLEKELADLIMKGEIHARIDSQSKILFARQDDQRRTTIANVVAAADNYLSNARALLLRNQVMKNGLVPVLEGENVSARDMYGGHVVEGRQLGWGNRSRGGGAFGEMGAGFSAIGTFVGNIVHRASRGGQ